VVAAGDQRLDQRAGASSPPWRGAPGIAFYLEEFRPRRGATCRCAQSQAGRNFFMEDFHAGGRMPALWRRLRDRLDLDAPTVGGETLGQIVARWPAYTDDE